MGSLVLSINGLLLVLARLALIFCRIIWCLRTQRLSMLIAWWNASAKRYVRLNHIMQILSWFFFSSFLQLVGKQAPKLSRYIRYTSPRQPRHTLLRFYSWGRVLEWFWNDLLDQTLPQMPPSGRPGRTQILSFNNRRLPLLLYLFVWPHGSLISLRYRKKLEFIQSYAIY